MPEGQGPRDLGQPDKEDARARRRRSRPPRSRTSSRRPSCSARLRRACGPSRSTPTSSSSRRASGRRRARWCAAARRRSASTRRCSPTSSSCCRRSPSRRASGSSGCSPRTPTGTTCWAATPSPTRRSASPSRRAARLRDEPGAAQRELRDFDEEHYVERPRRWRSARPGAAGPGPLRDRRARARAAPGRRPHRRRDGGLDPVGAVLVVRRLPLAGRDPDALAGRLAARLPRDARPAGAARRAGRARRARPRRGARLRRARWRSCARTAPTWRRSRAARRRRCRSRGGPALRGRSTPRTSRASSSSGRRCMNAEPPLFSVKPSPS